MRKKILYDGSGFTIIEVLIALAIFSIGFMAVGAVQVNSLMKTTSSRNQTSALFIMEQQAEALQGMPFYTDLDGDGRDDDVVAAMGTGMHSDNDPWTDRFTVYWQVVENGTGTNPWTGAAGFNVSKGIRVWVTPDGNPNSRLASVEFVKVMSADI